MISQPAFLLLALLPSLLLIVVFCALQLVLAFAKIASSPLDSAEPATLTGSQASALSSALSFDARIVALDALSLVSSFNAEPSQEEPSILLFMAKEIVLFLPLPFLAFFVFRSFL